MKIPGADGICEELSCRISEDITVKESSEEYECERTDITITFKLYRYEIFNGNKRIGIVTISNYESNGVTRSFFIGYDGLVPEYNNNKSVALNAYESDIDSRPKLIPKYNPKDLREYRSASLKPNNNQDNPMYRVDSHDLKLASHEVDGIKRKK